MINYLKFEKLNGIELIDLTNNTIVLFNNKESLAEFKNEFEKLINDIHYKYVAFSTDDFEESVNIEKVIVCRDITGIYNINNNEQRFILTVESISMLTIKSHYDLWLIDKNDDGKWNSIAFTDYQNHESYLTDIDVYRFVCESKYGCNLNK